MMWIDEIIVFMAERKDGLLVFAALLAAGASIAAAFVTAQASRKNRLAELRERWIGELREDVSEILAMRAFRLEERKFSSQQIIEQVIRYSAILERVVLRSC
jgi:hypothetical protein